MDSEEKYESSLEQRKPVEGSALAWPNVAVCVFGGGVVRKVGSQVGGVGKAEGQGQGATPLVAQNSEIEATESTPTSWDSPGSEGTGVASGHSGGA